MATAAKATVSLHLDTSGIVAQLRGLADAIEAITPTAGGGVADAGALVGYYWHTDDTRPYASPKDAEDANKRHNFGPGRVVEVREVSR